MRFLLLPFLCAALIACTSQTPSPGELFPDQSEVQIFQTGEAAMEKHNYEDATQHFESLNARYPFGTYAEQGQLDLIYCYYKHEDLLLALAAADHYIRLYPRGEHIDYAYYMRGIIQVEQNQGFFEHTFPTDFAKRDLTDLKKAYLDFEQLVRSHPKGIYAKEAKQKMAYILGRLSQHELQVAQFYYDHEAYVAAVNRAQEVIQHYQQTTAVPDALALLVKSYQKLGLKEDKARTLKVLKLNFPDSQAFKSCIK